MKKGRFRVISIFFVLLVLLTLLTACKNSSRSILSKCDDQQITINANYNCDVTVTLQVTENNETVTVTKDLELTEGKTQVLTLEDFGANYFSKNAVITRVIIIDDFDSSELIGDIIIFILIAVMFLLILFAVVGIPIIAFKVAT